MKLHFLLFLSLACSEVWASPTDSDKCIAVTGFHVTNVTPSAATLEWDDMAGAEGYVYVVSKSIVPPERYGHYIKESSHVETGLASARTFYAHVRAKCEGVQISQWSTVQFNTPPPQGVNMGSDNTFAVSLLPSQPDRSVTVRVKGSIQGTAVIWVEDASGRSLGKYDLVGDDIHIDVARLDPGIYYVCYNDALGRIKWLRFTK